MSTERSDYMKPTLQLLYEALKANPNPEHQKQVVVSEYTNSIAMRAKECLPELEKMFGEKTNDSQD